MEKCKVNMRYLVCNEMAGLCAFLSNENINDGAMAKIEEALQKEQPTYLERLIEDRAGSAFRICKVHQIIVNAAKKVLESKQN